MEGGPIREELTNPVVQGKKPRPPKLPEVHSQALRGGKTLEGCLYLVARPLVCAVTTALTELSSSRLSSAPVPAVLKLKSSLCLGAGGGTYLY